MPGQLSIGSVGDLRGSRVCLFVTKHILQNSLEGHGVAADTSGRKEEALAVPTTGIEVDFVDVVLAVEDGLKAGNTNPLCLLGVFPSLVHFADNARIHLPLLTPNYSIILKSAASRVKEAS